MLQILALKARLLRRAWARALTVVVGVALGGALAWRELRPAGEQRAPAADAVRPTEAATRPALGAPSDQALAAELQCLARLAELAQGSAESLPAVNRAELRAQILGRAKAAPVLFLSAPEADMYDARAAGLRRALEREPGYAAFNRVVGKVRSDPALARAVFLRDGYLYTESPELASLYASLTLSLLFRDHELRIARGSEQLSAIRLKDGDYEYGSGPERGKRAKLLLFDRVAAAGTVWAASRHVDLAPLARELGFDELVVTRAGAGVLAADLVYGALRVPSLLQVARDELSLACEAPGGARAALLAHRAQAARDLELQARLLEVMKAQVDEALPFDEPKTEEGQQDGKLRPEWRSAYLNGRSSFEFNGDRYAVFDASGRPRPPQVCIDFVLDTFERASGTWWQPRDQRRERRLGRLRFDRMAAVENWRSVERFIEFARAHPAEFDVYDLPAHERVPLRNRRQFFSSVYRNRQHYRRGDIVTILGPRADEKLHYHSFFVVEVDPLSGMPTELAANAGRPRIRTWEGEMSSAPRRSIISRIRPRSVWLESILEPVSAAAADALPSDQSGSHGSVPEPTAG